LDWPEFITNRIDPDHRSGNAAVLGARLPAAFVVNHSVNRAPWIPEQMGASFVVQVLAMPLNQHRRLIK
jgi:hypothetical protein